MTTTAPAVTWHNASHLRTDTWDELKIAAQRVHRASQQHEEATLELEDQVARLLAELRDIETYWAFPGRRLLDELERLWSRRWYGSFARNVARTVRLLVSDAYRRRDPSERELLDEDGLREEEPVARTDEANERPYFEVLLVDVLTRSEEEEVRSQLLALRDERDETVYDVVVVPSLEDALIAALVNPNLQSCVVRYSFPVESSLEVGPLRQYLDLLDPAERTAALEEEHRALALGRLLQSLRPELDLFLVTDAPVEEIAGRTRSFFRRVFYRQEDYRELHLSILKGIGERYESPFFSALQSYSQKPTGVFHALPISRGKSIDKSHWIRDMGRFYGARIFLAETSSTAGGLDSLLQPSGPLKKAQELAARAFGARRTYFVTNGTSTANKIVVQAVSRPGDIVLVDRDCHKSHHYGLLLAGARPIYLDSYPLPLHALHGAVPLERIRAVLRDLEAKGHLDKVRMVLLTNCTFDGLTYHPERVMQELLAIKPDLIFLWDEAWFGYASFIPLLRRRTAMDCARRIRARYKSPEYRARWEARAPGEALPDPDRVRVRVYATQSTHKTLTALRQGSMIHVQDQDFAERVRDAFDEAYMTHTSTSPNYQILASLDVGRRQVELEGYELVQKSVDLAMTLREKVASHPVLERWFRILGPADLVPESLRPSGLVAYTDPETGWKTLEAAWAEDEIVLDPTRVTIDVGRTGMDGDTFRRLLIDHYDIQINKTSRNTLLFMVHIGTTRGAIAYLIEVLCRVAEDLDERLEEMNPAQRASWDRRVSELVGEQPHLPGFSSFHSRFRSVAETPAGDIRSAFFLAYDETTWRYLPAAEAAAELAEGKEIVSATFVTPYPPGFPILVPGQVVEPEILSWLDALDVKEIHGYHPELGLRVFTDEVLARPSPDSAAAGA
jgi:arginine/lysine/ornithine decarboxylase